MSRARIYVRNLFANWFGYAANLLILFFMSPYVVHTLGDVDYGVWSLMMSLTGYLGLVELGTRAGVGRFINYYLGKKDPANVNAILTTGLAIFLGIGSLALLAGGTLALLLPWIFPKIPPHLLGSARIVCVLIAANLWMAFLSAPFRQVLQALERFDVTNGIDLLVLLVRTIGTLVALQSGYGLVTLAVVQLAGSLVGQGCVQWLARRAYAPLRISPSLVSRAHLRELCGFSIWSFLSAAAYRLVYSTDTIVIAILLGPEPVTYHSVGGMLLVRARDAVSLATGILYPRIMQDCATEDWNSVYTQFRYGTELAVANSILLFVGMVAFGREFIQLWMGPRFGVSYTILAILAISSVPTALSAMTGPVYAGLNRVRFAAILAILQGLTNLGLSVALVAGWGMGITGVAWGTFYPRIAFALLAWSVAMRWIHVPAKEALRPLLRWCTLAVLFALVCWLINALPWYGRWPGFFAKVGLAVVAYLPLALALLSSRADRAVLYGYLARKQPRWLTSVLRRESDSDLQDFSEAPRPFPQDASDDPSTACGGNRIAGT